MKLDIVLNLARHGEDILVKLPPKIAMALERNKTGTVDSAALITALQMTDNDKYMDSNALMEMIMNGKYE